MLTGTSAPQCGGHKPEKNDRRSFHGGTRRRPGRFTRAAAAVSSRLTEAERTRRELEPFLIEAIGVRKSLNVLEQDLSAVSTRILMMGGVLVPYAKLAEKRMEHQSLADVMKQTWRKFFPPAA